MKTLFSWVALWLLVPPLSGLSQIKIDKQNIPFNNYDNKYYYQGKPFSGIMKSGYNEICFVNGEVNGTVLSYDYSGKVFRKLTYTNGHFNGEFFTEKYKGAFREDTIIGKLTGFGYSSRNKEYEYDFRYLNNQVGVSYQFDQQGRISKQGIIYSGIGEYFFTAFGLIIEIDRFIEGEDFSRIRSFPNLIDFNTEKMHHFTSYYTNTGKVQYKQIFTGDSLAGEVSYFSNGRTNDSIRFLYPLNVRTAYENESLEKDLNQLYKNRTRYLYAENGTLQEKNTQKTFPPDNEASEISSEEPVTRFVGDFESHYSNGTLEQKWHFNESGKLDGDYLSNYFSGSPRIKARMENGVCSTPFTFYRPGGKPRFSITKTASGEWLFQEFLPDGFLKIKKVLSTEEVNSGSAQLISWLRIGNRDHENDLISETDNLLEMLFQKREEEAQ